MSLVVSLSFVLIVLIALFSISHADVSVKTAPSLSIFGPKCSNQNIETVLSDGNKLSSPFELYKASSHVVVGILNSHELRYNLEEIESYMQSYLDNIYYSKQSKELVIVYEVKVGETESAVQQSISRTNDVFHQLLDGFSSSETDFNIKENVKVTTFFFDSSFLTYI